MTIHDLGLVITLLELHDALDTAAYKEVSVC